MGDQPVQEAPEGAGGAWGEQDGETWRLRVPYLLGSIRRWFPPTDAQPPPFARFGARRKRHGRLWWTEYPARPGAPVLSPCDGAIEKIFYPFGTLKYRGLTISIGEFLVDLYYLDPLVRQGDQVVACQPVGLAQDVTRVLNRGHTPHVRVHVQALSDAVVTDEAVRSGAVVTMKRAAYVCPEALRWKCKEPSGWVVDAWVDPMEVKGARVSRRLDLQYFAEEA